MPIQPFIKPAIKLLADAVKKKPKLLKGLSFATVSTVLRNTFKVIEQNRERKRKKLEEGGYPYRKERMLRYKSEILKNLPER